MPFLTAFTIGYKAGITEEIMYRLFAINWGKKLFKRTSLAIIFSSILWGIAHSGYPIFPMWFRCVEVLFLGVLIAIFYLRCGIITVIVGHYLFDVFWNSAEYLLLPTKPFYFYSALIMFLLPAILSIVMFIINKKVKERPLKWNLNKNQKYNIDILKVFLSEKLNSGVLSIDSKNKIKAELMSHGWDAAVVEAAVDEIVCGDSIKIPVN